MKKRILSLILALTMILGVLPINQVFAENSEKKSLDVVYNGDDSYFIKLPGVDYSRPRYAPTEENQLSEEDMTKQWVGVNVHDLLMEVLKIDEVTLTVVGDGYKKNYVFKTREAAGQNDDDPSNDYPYYFGNTVALPVPRLEYAPAIMITFPDGRKAQAMVEANSVPNGYEVNIDFRAHTGIEVRWSGESDRPEVKANYKREDSEGYFFDLPKEDKNVVLRRGIDWVWKDYKEEDITYLNVLDDNYISIDKELTSGIEIKVDDKSEQGQLKDSKYYFNVSGDAFYGFLVTMREKNSVDFNPGQGSWKGEAPATQYAANGLKLSDTFMEGEDAIGPVEVPAEDQLTPPAAEAGQPDLEFKGWSDTENGQPVDMDTYVVKGDTTFYAVYGPKAQGQVNVKYVDTKGNEIADKYKKDDESYPATAGGNENEPVKADSIPQPQFIGYKRTDKTPVVADKTYKDAEKEGVTLDEVQVEYEKLPNVIPEKIDDGKDNPDATEEVKKTYAKVTYKADADKGTLKVGEKDATSPLVYYVNPKEGVQIKDVANVTAAGNENAYKVNEAKPWTFTPEEIDSTNIVVSADVTLTANFDELKANKFKDKLEPKDIKVWVDDTIDWKKGVALKEANADLQAILDEATVTDENSRTSEAANLPNGEKGNLKVAFDDNSSLIVKDQVLYVADKKVEKLPEDDPNYIDPKKLPEDKVQVDIKLGEGTQIGEGDAATKGNKDNPVTVKTFFVKPNTGLAEEDFPAVTAQDGYKDVKWTPTDKTATFAENGSFVASATGKSDAEKNNPQGQDITVMKDGTPKAEDGIKNKDKLTNVESYTFKDPVDTSTVGEKDATVVVTYKDKTKDEVDIKVIVIDLPDNEKYDPKGQEIVVKVGETPDAKDGISNKTDLPEGTNYTFKDPVDTTTVGIKDATVIVEYPDKTTDEVPTKVVVVDDKIIPYIPDDKNNPTNPEDKNIPEDHKDVAKYYNIVAFKTDPAEAAELSFNGEKGNVISALVPKNADNPYAWSEDFAPKILQTIDQNNQFTFDKWINKAGDPMTNQAIEDGEIYTAKFTGNSMVHYPDTKIEKGSKKDIVPTITDENGDPTKPDSKPVIKRDPGHNLVVTPKDDGTITVEVPEDYDGPDTITIPVEVVVDGEPKQVDITVTIVEKAEVPEEDEPVAPPVDEKGNWINLVPVGDSEKPNAKVEGDHYAFVYGYPDKSFQPAGQITRAEAAAMIARLAGLDRSDATKPAFADTPSSWYNRDINAMVRKDLMFGEDGNFRPNEPITRGEFARALYHIDHKSDKVAPFDDVKDHRFEEAINQAYGNGRITGYPDGTFKPDAPIQRAEATRLLNRYAGRNVEERGLVNVKNDLVQFNDLPKTHWAYYEVMEAANSHHFYRIDENNIEEMWTKVFHIGR